MAERPVGNDTATSIDTSRDLARSDARVNFPALANQFEAEYVGAFCGPASAAMVLNAVRGRSEDLPRDASRFRSEDLQYLPKGVDPTTPRFTQDNVIAKGPKTRAQIFGEPVTINGKQVHDFGFQLRQLDDMLKANGLATRLVVVDDSKDEQEIRADLINNLKRRSTPPSPQCKAQASVYRLLKAHDLIASPAYIVIKAAEEFQDKTTAPNQLWQTDFTYLKITGWGWYYLSTVLDDFSRFIVAWKLCATMKAQDVTATLDLALAASGLDQMTVVHRPRLLSDNGASYVAEDLAAWLNRQKIEHVRSAPITRRPRARSSAGIRRSRTASCSSTITCPTISNVRSRPSWLITTMPAITRAWAISRRPTSTSDEPRPSSSNAKGSSARQSQTVACSINCMPHNLNQR